MNEDKFEFVPLWYLCLGVSIETFWKFLLHDLVTCWEKNWIVLVALEVSFANPNASLKAPPSALTAMCPVIIGKFTGNILKAWLTDGRNSPLWLGGLLTRMCFPGAIGILAESV